MPTREQFLKELRKECRQKGIAFDVNMKAGKGSHYRITAGSKKTTLKGGDLSPQYCKLIRKQLGL